MVTAIEGAVVVHLDLGWLCDLRVTGGPCDACIGAGFVPVALTPQPIPAASNSHYISNGLRVVSGALLKLRLRGGRGGVALSLWRSGALALCRCLLFAGLDRRGLVRMFWARRDASAVNYRFLACLVANLDPNTRARHGVLGAGRAMELAHRKGGQLTRHKTVDSRNLPVSIYIHKTK